MPLISNNSVPMKQIVKKHVIVQGNIQPKPQPNVTQKAFSKTYSTSENDQLRAKNLAYNLRKIAVSKTILLRELSAWKLKQRKADEKFNRNEINEDSYAEMTIGIPIVLQTLQREIDKLNFMAFKCVTYRRNHQLAPNEYQPLHTITEDAEYNLEL